MIYLTKLANLSVVNDTYSEFRLEKNWLNVIDTLAWRLLKNLNPA